MKKIINPGANIVDEMITGLTKAYPGSFERVGDLPVYRAKERRKGKVVIVTGGGSGHEPLLGGLVGTGLADAVACGNVFAAPNPSLILEAVKAVDEGQGVLFLYWNYAGDNLNFDMAQEMCEGEGIQTATIRIWDDCVSAPPERAEDRRGVAGMVFMMKIAGAACDAGLSLQEVCAVVEQARSEVRSVGIATSSASIPGQAGPIFELGEDEMEYGMGIHGEPGVERVRMMTADALTERMYGNIKAELQLAPGDRACVLVNSLGSTTLMELGVVYKRLAELLEADGVQVHDADLKSYCTSQEMGGFSISILRMRPEYETYYDMPCRSPYYFKGV